MGFLFRDGGSVCFSFCGSACEACGFGGALKGHAEYLERAALSLRVTSFFHTHIFSLSLSGSLALSFRASSSP